MLETLNELNEDPLNHFRTQIELYNSNLEMLIENNEDMTLSILDKEIIEKWIHLLKYKLKVSNRIIEVMDVLNRK